MTCDGGVCGLQAAAAALAQAVAEGEAVAADRASLAQQLAAAETGVAGALPSNRLGLWIRALSSGP